MRLGRAKKRVHEIFQRAMYNSAAMGKHHLLLGAERRVPRLTQIYANDGLCFGTFGFSTFDQTGPRRAAHAEDSVDDLCCFTQNVSLPVSQNASAVTEHSKQSLLQGPVRLEVRWGKTKRGPATANRGSDFLE